MRSLFQVILAMALLPFAQAMAQQDESSAKTTYVISYLEVAPAQKEAAAGLLRQLADASRKEAGALRFEVLQRMTPPNHFVILEIWRDQQALDTHAAGASARQFREKVQPMLIAPIDDRFCIATAVAAPQSAAGAVYVVTHVDVTPPGRDKIIEAFKMLVGPSRSDAGNLRFDVLQQKNRSNHFTMIETWKDQGSEDSHQIAAHTKQFRDALGPLTGALYDQRWYRAL